MKLYKFYGEKNAESRENSAQAFEDIIMEQNGNEGSVFNNFNDAKKAYDEFKIYPEAQRTTHTVVFFTFDGKLLEEAEISDTIYQHLLDEGESLHDIYYSCTSWDVKLINVSAPFAD